MRYFTSFPQSTQMLAIGALFVIAIVTVAFVLSVHHILQYRRGRKDKAMVAHMRGGYPVPDPIVASLPKTSQAQNGGAHRYGDRRKVVGRAQVPPNPDQGSLGRNSVPVIPGPHQNNSSDPADRTADMATLVLLGKIAGRDTWWSPPASNYRRND